MNYATLLASLVLICNAISVCSARQNTAIDSLERELANHASDDEDKLDLLNKLSTAYSVVDPEKGLQYAEQLIELGNRLRHFSGMAEGYSAKARSLSVLGKDSLAIAAYEKSRSIYMEHGEPNGAAVGNYNLGILYNNAGRYREALAIYEEVFEAFKQTGRKDHILGALNSLGVTYFYLGDHLTAIDYYYKGIEVAESINDSLQLGNLYLNIGLIYKRISKLEEAIDMYQRAGTIMPETTDKTFRVNLLGNMASAYDEMEETQKAIALYEQALALAKDIGFKRGEASNLTNLGVVYFGINDYVRSMEYLNRGLSVYEQTPDNASLSLIYGYQGRIWSVASDVELLEMGLDPADKFSQAMQLSLRSLEIAKEIGHSMHEYWAYYNLSVIYEQQHRYQEALEAHKAFVDIRDRLEGEEQNMDMLRLEMEYEMGKRDALALAEIEQHKTARNTIIAGGILLLVMGTGGAVAYKKRQDSLKKQRELAFRASLSETEMRVLRLQMNPHFIFNSLNSISDYISRNDIESADYYLAKFAKLMRGILENSEEPEIPLADELQMLQLYMQLEASRLGGKFTHEISVDDNIDANETMVPPLILQPFVENSIWHGLSRKEGQGKIKIEVTKDNGMIRCVVEDDGIGRRSPQVTKNGRKSYGTNITSDRIEMLNKLKNANASVHVIDLEQGTRVEVKLPTGELLNESGS